MQSKLLYTTARRDRLTREFELIILPLETMKQDYIKKDPSYDIWRIDPVIAHAWDKERIQPAKYTEFKDLVKNIIQYKYLCPRDLCQLIDEFLIGLKDRESSKEFEKFFSEVTYNLFVKKLTSEENIWVWDDGPVGRRRSEILKELYRLEPKEGRIKRCTRWIRRRSFYNKTREHFIKAKTFCRKIRYKI